MEAASTLTVLPLELILHITNYLPAVDFISLAFAHYPLFQNFGLIPTLSTRELAGLLQRSSLPSMFILVPLPVEILLHTLRYLSPFDTMRFVLANYHDLAAKGIAPPLTEGTLRALRRARLDDAVD